MGKQWLLLASVILALLIVLVTAADSNRILPLNPGNAASFHDPKYKLEFHELGSHYVPEEADLEMIPMTDRDLRKFECFLPKQPEIVPRDLHQQNETAITVADDTKLSRKTPEEILDLLKDNCVHRAEGWWTYELCYKGKFRQLHFDHTKKEIKEIQEFVLGVYDPEATARLHMDNPVLVQKDPRSQNAAQKYYAQMYTNGTKCDLTNTPRETEVRFVCSESDSGTSLISSIKESPTCRYTAVFQAPMLCKHPLFQEERHPWLVVNCNAVASEESSTSDVIDLPSSQPAEEAVVYTNEEVPSGMELVASDES